MSRLFQARFALAAFRLTENGLKRFHQVTHKLKVRIGAAVAFLFALNLPLAAQTVDPVINVDHGPNAPAQQKKHYVVLVSLDGFRYDYAAKYGAKNLEQMAADGASAPDGMIPSL